MGAVQSSTVAKDAKDTESPAITSTVKSDQNQQAESYAVPIRPENANLFSGGTQHTAGGKSREATFVDGLRSIRLSDLKDMHTKPCVREALMTGIGAGFGIGGLKAILGCMLRSLLDIGSLLTIASSRSCRFQLGCGFFYNRIFPDA